jgi:hypothetical protein
MKFKTFVASLLLVGIGLVGPGVASSYAAPAHSAKHACTHTSSGSCIRGGQFCPKAKYGKSGYSASGKRYVCKGSHSHPHWMIP